MIMSAGRWRKVVKDIMGFEDYCLLGYGVVWYPYGCFGGASCFHS